MAMTMSGSGKLCNSKDMMIFRKPPGPTVLVTTAHCTFLCKNDTKVVDNCCCNNVGNIDCSDNVERCGSNPTVVEMTGMNSLD